MLDGHLHPEYSKTHETGSAAHGFAHYLFGRIHVMNPLVVAGIIVGILILASAVLTALICLYRAGRRKRITYAAMFVFPFIATFSVMFCGSVCIDGLSVFTRYYWAGYRAGPEIVFTIYGFIFAVCFLPALVVAAYYKWRNKRDETSMV